MKNLLAAFLLLFSLETIGQAFEGTITWSIQMEITDPQLKAQMDQAQKEMQDPEKLKELQKSLEDPQVKAMMEKNPQMKAQMEQALKMLQGGDLSSMIPKGMAVKVKDGHMLTKLEGGIMQSEVLSRADKNETYIIDRESKTYRVTSNNDYGVDSHDSLDVEVTKTGETLNILGYACTKYQVKMTAAGGSMTQNIWATSALKGFDLSAMARQQQVTGNRNAEVFRKIDGVPLKVVVDSPQGIVTMEAQEVKRQSLSASEFEIPAGFKETR